MALSSYAEATEDRAAPLRERIATWGHAPLRGSRHLVPSILRSAVTEDGRAWTLCGKTARFRFAYLT
jgi:hypothetical protein